MLIKAKLFSFIRSTSLATLFLASLSSIFSVSFNANAIEKDIKDIDVKIDIPASFVSANNFAGFVQPQTFTTIRYEEKVISFNQAKQATLNGLKDIQEQQDITISEKPGVLIRHHESIDGNEFERWTLIFGDNISSIAITASYPKIMAKKSSDNMLATLKSTRWLRLPSEQIFTGLPFVANETEDLKITQRNLNSIVMLDKAMYDNSDVIIPSIVLSVGYSEKPLEEIATFSKQQLKAKRLENIEIIKQQGVSISNVQGFEITASATDNRTNTQAKLIQTIIYKKNRYLLVQGIVSKADAHKFWAQFQEVINSVKFK